MGKSVNLNVDLGNDLDSQVIFVDLAKNNLHQILLLGESGSGKSIFHNNLYKGISIINNPEQVGFVFIDNTMADFMSWESPYIIQPTSHHEAGMKALEALAKQAENRFNNTEDNSRAIIIHVEECDLMVQYPERFENVWESFAGYKNKSNMYLIFSTSKPSNEVLTKKILDNTDLKVVFALASNTDSEFILGNDSATQFSETGERFLVFKDQTIHCRPFPPEITTELMDFELK